MQRRPGLPDQSGCKVLLRNTDTPDKTWVPLDISSLLCHWDQGPLPLAVFLVPHCGLPALQMQLPHCYIGLNGAVPYEDLKASNQYHERRPNLSRSRRCLLLARGGSTQVTHLCGATPIPVAWLHLPPPFLFSHCR